MFPQCIEVNKVFKTANNEIDVSQKILKTYSADFCAKKGKEESSHHQSTTKRTVWTWYSTSKECVIHTFNEEQNRTIENLSHGKLPEEAFFMYFIQSNIGLYLN